MRLVPVQEGVKVEVIDWGGSGPALVLLAGLGDTAHVYDKFGPKLVPYYHVYGITRRGFGASSVPPPENGNYSADRLGDDVLAVICALSLNRPILAGHSVAGEELSSVASRHPERISVRIYIDAGYPYALYDEVHGDLVLDSIAMRSMLEHSHLGTLHLSPDQLHETLTETQRLQRQLQQRIEDLSSRGPPHPIDNPIVVAISMGRKSTPTLTFPSWPSSMFRIRLPFCARWKTRHTLSKPRSTTRALSSSRMQTTTYSEPTRPTSFVISMISSVRCTSQVQVRGDASATEKLLQSEAEAPSS